MEVFLRATLSRCTGGAPGQTVFYNGFTIRPICRSDEQLVNVRYRTVQAGDISAPPHCPSPFFSMTIRTFPSALESRAPQLLHVACSQSPAFPIQRASG